MVLCLPTIQRSHTSHFPFRLKAYGYSVASSCFSACSRANARVGVAFGTFVAEVLPETFVRDVFGENNRFVRGRAAWHAGLGPEFPEPVICFSVPVLASVRRVGCVESISGVPMCVRESGRVGDSIRNRRPVLDYNRSVGRRSVVTCELVSVVARWSWDSWSVCASRLPRCFLIGTVLYCARYRYRPGVPGGR